MDAAAEELDIVIAGGGISGLATALALHRKGIRSVVMERSEALRATGAGIAILTNGWRALEELGVASKLRQTALLVQGIGEARCLKRSDLIKALAEDLPPGTIRFGCQILSIKLDDLSYFPILQLSNGKLVRSKILIGCDGANSVVADFLGLKPTKVFPLCAVRGYANYPHGHGFSTDLVRLRKGNVMSGRVPIDNNLAFWFVVQRLYPRDSKAFKDPELIKELCLESIKDFPRERIELIKNCDLNSLSLTTLRYRAPWEILLGRFRNGCVTVAGDAMHVMGPFLGQGGSAGIEDAVVLARCLSQKMNSVGQLASNASEDHILWQQIGEAMDQYVKERRMRLVWMSTQTYLTGKLLGTSSMFVKLCILMVLVLVLPSPLYHTRYHCGRL
ncbi:hypothetical protein Tsubulata_010408 [Turnera subulata]|uniref:FAD-binding domain-containing protein n=1 Tax=Turnera subulata TaxID=218843 RepID=A0A9Q0JMQ8_9ROSI|nr:hypothetical protein Tsubulata_010408 [Turnera subulata]